jgi:putative hydrolase of the HAD superfamily
MVESHRKTAGNSDRSGIHLLFDLDETLYPASTGLFRLVGKRIHHYICETLQLEPGEARDLQKEYWRRCGTSLYGLMLYHDIDPDPFLDYVHDIAVEEHLSADQQLQDLLAGLPHHKHVFSNGPAGYIRRVLRTLGVEEYFEEIFDIRRSGYVPKPNDQPYDRVMESLGGEGRTCVLIEDAAKNLPPARARGWRTVWLRSSASWLEGNFGTALAVPEEVEADLVLDDLHDIESGLETLLEGTG